jgi:flotillin
MEEERIVLQQKRLMADVIEPARAKREAMELEARGEAASILENGNANIAVLTRMIETWKTAEGQGEKIFLMNMLPDIIAHLSETVANVQIDKLSIIDGGGDGKSGAARAVTQLPSAVISMAEMIGNATGVDILGGFRSKEETREVQPAQE